MDQFNIFKNKMMDSAIAHFRVKMNHIIANSSYFFNHEKYSELYKKIINTDRRILALHFPAYFLLANYLSESDKYDEVHFFESVNFLMMAMDNDHLLRQPIEVDISTGTFMQSDDSNPDQIILAILPDEHDVVEEYPNGYDLVKEIMDSIENNPAKSIETVKALCDLSNAEYDENPIMIDYFTETN